MSPLNRRQFLGAAAGAAGIAALGAACSDGETSTGGTTTEPVTAGTQPLPSDPSSAPFDTVVVLMMENRSFDHFLGWLPGADGKQAGLSFTDHKGDTHETWHMAPDWQGCDFQDPIHLWQAMFDHYDDGACDGFLKTQPEGDLFPIAYYLEEDLPILSALAQGYTLYDRYFASMMGPTWPNRLYQLCATTDITTTGTFPEPGQPRPVNLDLAIFDRVRDAGLTTGYYTWGEPMTELFTSGRYDDITYPYTQFLEQAKEGTLPNVTFVDPDYTAHNEFIGLSNDYHPYGSIRVAEEFVAQVHDALTSSPQWDRMVAFLNFDESGGFFDHVPPPRVQDDTVLPGPGPNPELTILGFRVPAVTISPFAPRKIESAGPYEHCSILKFIEWRWGLEPMTLRDRTANNIGETLDFTTRRDPITLPAFKAEPAEECNNPHHLP